MSTLEKQTPPTQFEKPNPITFFGNKIIGHPVLNNLASHLKGVEFAEFMLDQKKMELEKQQPVEIKTGA